MALEVLAFLDGELVVFDSDAQPASGGAYVLLWSSATRKLEQYDLNTVKKQLSEVTDTEVAGRALAEYESYRIAAGRIAEEKASRNYYARMKRLGIPSPGTRRATARQVRITHCYACQNALDSRVQLECWKCHWIICECGACGCGRFA